MYDDLWTGSSSGYPQDFFAVGSFVYFIASTGTYGTELYKIPANISGGGGASVEDIYAGTNSSTPTGFTVVGNLIFFSADDGVNGRELWLMPFE